LAENTWLSFWRFTCQKHLINLIIKAIPFKELICCQGVDLYVTLLVKQIYSSLKNLYCIRPNSTTTLVEIRINLNLQYLLPIIVKVYIIMINDSFKAVLLSEIYCQNIQTSIYNGV